MDCSEDGLHGCRFQILERLMGIGETDGLVRSQVLVAVEKREDGIDTMVLQPGNLL